MLSVPVHISFRISLIGRRSAEPEHRHFRLLRAAGLLAGCDCVHGKQAGMPVWRTDLEVCVPSELDGLFQFK